MYIAGVLGIVFLVAFDRWTKYLALVKLKPVKNITVIEGFLDLTFVENRGAAFGMMQGARWFFVVLTLGVLAVILYYYRKLPVNRTYNIVRGCLVFISAGAIGNLIDRLFSGYVIDFLEVTFISFPVFNAADIFVVCGTVVFAYMLLFRMKD